MRREGSREFDTPDFRRAARQRLDAARYLLESEDFRLEAIYLALFVVECAMKSLILARLREGERKAMVKAFIKDGEKSHYFEYLKAKLENSSKNKIKIPIDLVNEVQVIALEWKTNLRYMAGKRDLEKARSFVDAAAKIYAWTERSL